MTMEDAIRYALTLLALSNVPVAQDIFWQIIIKAVLVRFNNTLCSM